MNTLAHTHAPASVRLVVFPPEVPTFFFFLVQFVQAAQLVKVKVLPPLLFFFDKVYILYIFCYLRYFGTHTCFDVKVSLLCMLICVGGPKVSPKDVGD